MTTYKKKRKQNKSVREVSDEERMELQRQLEELTLAYQQDLQREKRSAWLRLLQGHWKQAH